MTLVRAKKHLGQHFLTDKNIAAKIVDSLRPENGYSKVLEVGPGMGILSDFLLQKSELEVSLIDIDTESYEYLKKKYPALGKRLINADFLEIIRTPNSPELSPDDISLLLDNYDDLALWKEKFPHESFLLKGFAIMTLFDVTIENAISSLKSDLLGNSPAPDLQRSFESIFRRCSRFRRQRNRGRRRIFPGHDRKTP